MRSALVAGLTGVVLLVAGLAGVPAQAAPTVPEGVWPLRPRPAVVSDFDPPETRWGAGHRGVDLAGRVGQPVLSALPGKVSFASILAGRGVVVVDHGATRTTYEPVVADVRVGDLVAAGDPIGRLELAGSHCVPRACLHWGWRRGGTYLDPLDLVGVGPVRLLPLQGTVTTSADRLPPIPDLAYGAAALTPAGVPAGRPGGAAHW